MKIKIKVDELINILIQKHEESVLKKYNLNNDKILKIQKSLQKGNWKFVN
ncbi:MAG: hypothetical protein ACE5NL_00920 [Candidatus Hydrothermarchaeaceae archaeon]